MDLYELYDGVVRCDNNVNVIFDSEYDVIVAGLGTAGAICAISSAEHGLNVLGIEKQHMMGGTATCGQVLGYYYGAPGGRFEEIDRVVTEDDLDLFIPANKRFPDHILPEKKAIALEEAALQAGVQIKYEAHIEGVYLDGKQVVGVLWRDVNGLHCSSAKYVIDCTAEAEICAMCGCERMHGRQFDQKAQPWSLSTLKLDFCSVQAHYVDVGYVNTKYPNEVSKELLDCYTGPMFMRDNYTAEDFFTVIAPMMGIREGSTIVGEQTITFDDFLNEDLVQNPIFYSFSNVDTHSVEHAFESDSYLKWRVVAGLHMLNFAVPVPKGALVPKGFNGILVAGRCLSVDHNISPVVRMKKDMQKCGEAAAAMAYLSIRDNVDAMHTNDEELRGILQKSGCLCEDNNKMSYLICEKWTGEKVTTPIKWLTDYTEIKETMNKNYFGVAIWSALRLGEAAVPTLRTWLNDSDYNVAMCSALALGLMGDTSALTNLRQRLALLPGYVDGAEVFEQRRDHATICLVGMLNDTQSVSILKDILFMSLTDAERIQYCFFAISALMRIMENCTDVGIKQDIHDTLGCIVDNGIEFQIKLNGKYGIYSDVTEQVHSFIKRTL